MYGMREANTYFNFGNRHNVWLKDAKLQRQFNSHFANLFITKTQPVWLDTSLIGGALMDIEPMTSKCEDETSIKSPNSYPPSSLGLRRSMCQYDRLSTGANSRMRYCSEDVLQLSPIPFQRTTMDYKLPEVSPRLIATLVEDLEIDTR
ncbi:hypothetical protein ACTXT7_002254 [Hymenolepis weldensis]